MDVEVLGRPVGYAPRLRGDENMRSEAEKLIQVGYTPCLKGDENGNRSLEVSVKAGQPPYMQGDENVNAWLMAFHV